MGKLKNYRTQELKMAVLKSLVFSLQGVTTELKTPFTKSLICSLAREYGAKAKNILSLE